ncbi:MAG: hypothetical protein JWO72_1216 [Caulobacteraceae bacterium]|jgi:hypothetical protein|nr:hypothetical protein [Caulobacteraceae bacterium]
MPIQRSRISPTRPIVAAAILVILLIAAAVKPPGKADARSERISQEAHSLEQASAGDPR